MENEPSLALDPGVLLRYLHVTLLRIQLIPKLRADGQLFGTYLSNAGALFVL